MKRLLSALPWLLLLSKPQQGSHACLLYTVLRSLGLKNQQKLMSRPTAVIAPVTTSDKGQSKMQFSETDYYVKDGVRHVKPYAHEFIAYAKGRWVGLDLLTILCKEFGSHPRSYWVDVISLGNVLINDRKVSSDYVMRNGDRLLHRSHRHEPPIVGEIKLLGETSDLIAVSKPASLPMHPCGAYRYNTLMFILAKEPLVANQPRLNLVHRLDRVTSGVVVLAKTKEAANRVCNEIRMNKTKKVYLARVKGRFPRDIHKLRTLSLEEVTHNLHTLGAATDDNDENEEGQFDMSEDVDIPMLKRARTDDSSDIPANANKPTQDELDAMHSLIVELGSKIRTIKELPQSDENTLHLNGYIREISVAQEAMKVLSMRKRAAEKAANVGRSQPAYNLEGEKVVIFTATDEVIACPDVGYYITDSGAILLRCPVGVVSFREGIHACAVDGKQVNITS